MAVQENTFASSTFLSRIYAKTTWKAMAMPVCSRYFLNFSACFFFLVASSIPYIKLCFTSSTYSSSLTGQGCFGGDLGYYFFSSLGGQGFFGSSFLFLSSFLGSSFFPYFLSSFLGLYSFFAFFGSSFLGSSFFGYYFLAPFGSSFLGYYFLAFFGSSFLGSGDFFRSSFLGDYFFGSSFLGYYFLGYYFLGGAAGAGACLGGISVLFIIFY